MKCYCGIEVAEGRYHYPGNDPESGPAHKPAVEDPTCPECGCPRHDGDCTDHYNLWVCYYCGSQSADGEGWVERTVDDDPGDPEVGPQPNVIDVDVCPKCEASHAR